MATLEGCNLAFSIPQIQESIFRRGNLSLNDLANASRVNRSWSQMVSPFLWENITTVIDLTQEWSEGFQSGIASQGQWTRTLHTSNDHVLDWCSHHCTRLFTIDAGPLSECWKTRNSLFNLISRNPELQTLRWSAEFFDNDCLFSDISPGLVTSDSKSLTTLVLKNIQVNDSVCKVLNHHSATMNYLEISGCTFFPNTFFVWQQPQQSRSNLKRLHLKGNGYSEESKPEYVNSFLNFLESTTEVVDFDFSTKDLRLIPVVTRVLTGSYQDGSIDGVRPPSLGLLKTLKLRYSGKVGVVGIESARELLDALPDSLTNLTLTRFAFGAPTDLAISNLVQRNHDRLTSIRLVNCVGTVSSESWQFILTNCRHLEAIEMNFGWSMLDVQIGMKEPWVCLNLECFGGDVLVGSSVLSSSNNDSEDVNDGLLNDCEMFFAQLTALTKLKKLQSVLVDNRHRKPGWGLQRAEMENRFLSMWSRLESCTAMKKLDIGFLMPDMERIEVEIEKKSREMWGHEAKIYVRKRMYSM